VACPTKETACYALKPSTTARTCKIESGAKKCRPGSGVIYTCGTDFVDAGTCFEEVCAIYTCATSSGCRK